MSTLPKIPQGRTKEEIQQREKVIKNFYVNWNAANPEKRIYNTNFSDIIIMQYNKARFGKIKLTVGILRGSKQKIQYCITAIEKTTIKPATYTQ